MTREAIVHINTPPPWTPQVQDLLQSPPSEGKSMNRGTPGLVYRMCPDERKGSWQSLTGDVGRSTEVRTSSLTVYSPQRPSCPLPTLTPVPYPLFENEK